MRTKRTSNKRVKLEEEGNADDSDPRDAVIDQLKNQVNQLLESQQKLMAASAAIVPPPPLPATPVKQPPAAAVSSTALATPVKQINSDAGATSSISPLATTVQMSAGELYMRMTAVQSQCDRISRLAESEKKNAIVENMALMGVMFK